MQTNVGLGRSSWLSDFYLCKSQALGREAFNYAAVMRVRDSRVVERTRFLCKFLDDMQVIGERLRLPVGAGFGLYSFDHEDTH